MVGLRPVTAGPADEPRWFLGNCSSFLDHGLLVVKLHSNVESGENGHPRERIEPEVQWPRIAPGSPVWCSAVTLACHLTTCPSESCRTFRMSMENPILHALSISDGYRQMRLARRVCNGIAQPLMGRELTPPGRCVPKLLANWPLECNPHRQLSGLLSTTRATADSVALAFDTVRWSVLHFP